MGERMTEQQGSETGQGQTQQQGGRQSEQGKQPPWGDAENFNAEKAWEMIQNLRKEKGGGKPDPTLQAELESLRQAQTKQQQAIAAALGVKPEETSDTERLGQQIAALQGQIVASERRAVSATTGVPEHLLTANTAEDIRTQAQQFKEFAEASHAAALATQAQQTPEFQQIPGQGQNGQASPEAQADAEYKAFYPDPK